MNDGISAGNPNSVPQMDNVEFVDTPAAPTPAAPRRISELGQPGTTVPPERLQQMQPLDAPEAPTEQPEAPTEQPEAPTEQPEAVDYEAKYKAILEGQDWPEELLDRVFMIPNGKDEPIPMLGRDIPGAVLRHRDYTQKTTEVAQMRKEYEQAANARMGWVRALTGQDPDTSRLQALRAVLDNNGMESLFREYVQEEWRLQSMPPELQEMYRRSQAEADKAAALQRKLRQLEQQQQLAEQERVQREGVQAPAIQMVLNRLETRVPELLQQQGLADNPIVADKVWQTLLAAADGNRGPDGRWTIQPGVMPGDDMINDAISLAREELVSIAQKYARYANKPTPVPSGGGPALPQGAPGNPGRAQPRRFSDMGQ